MWMAQTKNVSFTWLDGHVYNIKDVKEYPLYDRYVKIKLRAGDKLDEIASRTEIYGEGEDSSAFLLFEANIEKIAENDYDLDKFKELRIPVVV